MNVVLLRTNLILNILTLNTYITSARGMQISSVSFFLLVFAIPMCYVFRDKIKNGSLCVRFGHVCLTTDNVIPNIYEVYRSVFILNMCIFNNRQGIFGNT